MHTRVLAGLALGAALLAGGVPAAEARAQRADAAPAGVRPPAPADRLLPAPPDPGARLERAVRREGPPAAPAKYAAPARRGGGRRKPYVLTGALAGAALAGGVAARAAARCSECFFNGPYIVVATGVGAAGGALAGLAASQVARVNARRPPADSGPPR